ncbi:MAG: multidrug effflux MFS transporter [Actinomycetia bacterium]|nr:multidrug effflux MFS transporter [Actinomycetes bacterium]
MTEPASTVPAAGSGARRVGERELIGMLAAISATTALGIDMALPAFTDLRIGLGLDPESPRIALTVTLYLLGLASAQLVYGPFADRFGRKPVLYAGLGLYTLGALGSALAPTFGVLVVSRFIWGVGAAGPRALSLAIGRDLYGGDQLARILAVVASVFMIVPALAPLIGQGVLALGSWRWVMGAPMVVTVALILWLTRLPESLPPERRRPLTLNRTRTAVVAVFSSRLTIGSALAVMFDFGSFAAFLGSSQLLFDDIYGRGDQFAFYFAGMSLVMGLVVFLGSRQVRKVGADRVIVVTLPLTLVLAVAVAVWSWQTDGQPGFYGWVALLTVINSLRTLVNPLLQAQAMEPMGDLAGTASAVIGTLSLGGGALLASLVDRSIAGSVTPLALAYAGYGALSLGFALWARRPEPAASDSAPVGAES